VSWAAELNATIQSVPSYSIISFFNAANGVAGNAGLLQRQEVQHLAHFQVDQ